MTESFPFIEIVDGELNLPGDKSISHRAVMFSSLAKGTSKIINLSNGHDVKSTISCLRELGVQIKEYKTSVLIQGKGFNGLTKSYKPLDAGNSGTTTRLISGILITQNFESKIIGDQSLSRRPMKRIIIPLSEMGGIIQSTPNYTLPIKIFPAENLKAINYELPVASAQVKSAILLAGLHIEDVTTVIERTPSRDHTERMLGLSVEKKDGKKFISVSKKNYPEAKEYLIPSDISTASFFIVFTLLCKNGNLVIKNVSMNETRTGIITILKKMGGDIQFVNLRTVANEPMGDIVVKNSKLVNTEIDEQIIPNIIDEIPILAVAGLFAEGDFHIKNVEELRGKESDRISAICYNMKQLGLDVEEFSNGFSFNGEIKVSSPTFESFNDHRIAMAFAILSMLLPDGGKVNHFDCVSISNPDFMEQIRTIIR